MVRRQAPLAWLTLLFLWPMLAWGMLLLLHYLLYKSWTVDERWADARVEELNLKSYDRGHIESIKKRPADEDGRN